MATARSERPQFFDGQYLGGADLAATVDYARELSREAALAGQSWGICIGLDLVEVANASGSFDYFVLPGLAFDGYGRQVVVLAPAPVPAALFASMPSGNQRVWIRYDQTQTRGLRPGWESCDAQDAYARVRESFAIEAGPKTGLSDQQSGIDIAGTIEPDPRKALIAIDADAPLMCDGSAPHQTFPDDTARWMIPLGCVAWTVGAPGSLGQRSEDAKKESRRLRRYVGQVAESLFAADGILRLRDRKTDVNDTMTPDGQCAAASVTTDDLAHAPDPKDTSKTIERLVGKELVWVEGHMRVTGDARLWGTRLELRDKTGGEAGAPLSLQRAASANADGGQDLDITIGAKADGKSRLLAGVAEPGQPFAAKLQLRNDGRLAVGPVMPADVKSHTILAYTEGDTSVAIGAGANKLARLQFTTGPALAEAAHLGFDDATKLFRLGAGTDLTNFTYVTRGGQVGIRTTTPDLQDGDANDLVVASAFNCGITIQAEPGNGARLNFSDGTGAPANRHAGSLRYDLALQRMEFWTAAAARIAIDSAGNLGVGTMTPAARLEIQSVIDAHSLALDADAIQARNGGIASQLQLQRSGGGVVIGGALGAEQQMSFGADGRVGLGTLGPAAALHLRRGDANIAVDTTGGTAPRFSLMSGGVVQSALAWAPATGRTTLSNAGTTSLTAAGNRVGINIGGDDPVTNLHVRGTIDGDASVVTSHVAFIENTAGGSADVLALRVNVANPGASNNFVTFFGSGGAIGRIEGNGANGVTLLSGGADFAECLPREAGAAIGPGRIVGVRGGRVSLDTTGADSLLVTTDRAIVVGNAPPADERHCWERVALVGQVPVTVDGPVAAGDFILPSGRDDGLGRAVAPGALAPGQAGQVLGQAWQGAEAQGRNTITIAVGIGSANATRPLAVLLSTQAHAIAALERRLAELEARAGN